MGSVERDPVADFWAGNLSGLLSDMQRADIDLGKVHQVAGIIRKYERTH